jgi:mannose-6-phosphate isomerase-like protein (cupin superfamily)
MFESEAAERLAREAAGEWFRDRLAGTADRAAGRLARAVVLESPSFRRGVMPPLYTHDVDESFQVLEGEVVFHVGGETVQASAGDVVVAPRHVPRTFHVLSERARWLVVTSLRSLARYEDFQRAVAPAEPDSGCAAWAGEEDHATLSGIAAANGIEILGPPGLLPRAA